MSYKYLVTSKEGLLEMLGEPIDVTSVPVKILHGEGWFVDKNGKDMTNSMYGKTRPDQTKRMTENNPMKNPEVAKRSGDSNVGKRTGKDNPFYGRGNEIEGKNNPNWKGGISLDKAKYHRQYRENIKRQS